MAFCNQTCLPSSRFAKPKRRRRRAKAFRFLALPTEIRVQIYELVFQGRILIQGNKPNKELEEAKTLRPWNRPNAPVARPRYRLSHALDNHDIDAGLQLSPALLLVCKKIFYEAEPYLYSQPTFCFTSMKTVNKFLNVSSRTGTLRITTLEIHHEGYGIPSHTGYQRLKVLHDLRWHQVCSRIGNDMTGITCLKVDITIQDLLVTGHLRDQWFSKGLLQLVHKRRIDHVEVALLHRVVGDKRLDGFSRRLEDQMMTVEGQHLRDEREANHAIARYYEAQAAAEAEKACARAIKLERQKLLPPVQAKSVLKIVIAKLEADSVQLEQQVVKKEAKRYYTSKLDQYERELVYGCNWPAIVEDK